MQCELSPMVRLELSAMAYSRWCDAFDGVKNAKKATWESTSKSCPKADWPSFYEYNLNFATKEFEKACTIKDEICKYSPLILKE